MKTLLNIFLILCFDVVCIFCANISEANHEIKIENSYMIVLGNLQFINPPPNITIDCSGLANIGLPLQVVNTDPNCLTNTSIMPTVSGNATTCGGVLTYQWTFTDVCGQSIVHVQSVTVAPMPPAYFDNPLPDLTISYNNIPISGPALQATNNVPTGCTIDEAVLPIQSGSATICGGNIFYQWTYTDVCNRTITHLQTLTINPLPEAIFVSPPADITVDCSSYPLTNIPALAITNNVSGNGAINTSVNPIVEDSVINCEGFVDLIYTYTDFCNRVTYHKQRITVEGKKYQIAGFCFTDTNNNNIFDTNKDFSLSNVAVQVVGDSVVYYTNNDGYYKFYLDTGIQEIKYIINFGSWLQDTIVKAINVIKAENYLFTGFKPQNNNVISAVTTLTSSSVTCKSFSNLYAQVFNTSSSLLSGYLIIQFDPKTYFTSMNPLPSGGESNYLVWNIIDLPPGKTFRPTIKFWVPDITTGDDSLLFKALVVSSISGDTLSTFPYNIKFDCNTTSDLTRNFPNREGEENFTLAGENITYQIQFSNNLATTAKTIKIINKIDKNLNISSVKIHKASHNFNVYSVNNDLIFASDSIGLDPKNEGYVIFSLDQNPSLKEKTIIEHEASIKIDNIVTYVTNKVINTIVGALPCDLLDAKIKIVDNILLMSDKGTSYNWYECGKTQLLYSFNNFQPNKNGSYYCIVEGSNCKTISDCIEFISTKTIDTPNIEIFVYPNPVYDFLYVNTIEKIEIEVRDIYGNLKLMTKENFVDFRDLIPGLYFVKTSNLGLQRIYKVLKY